MYDALIQGLFAVFQWPAVGVLFLGVFLGIWLGALPGLGGIIGLVLMLPFTFGMDPYSAIAVMMGLLAVTTTSDTIPAVLIGVPGTIGGALIMNAGAYGNEISNYFHAATTMTMAGEIKNYSRGDIEFAYRSSTFPKDEILINSTFICEKGNVDSASFAKTADVGMGLGIELNNDCLFKLKLSNAPAFTKPSN